MFRGLELDIERAELPPRIAALPRTDTGIPVTWASAWGSELDVVVRPDPMLETIFGVEVPAYFTNGSVGEGEPHINHPHPARVRESAINGWCQVCGYDLEPGARWICGIFLGQEEFRAGKRMVPLLIDSWTCNECIGFSLRFCPNLKRRPQLKVYRVHQWLLVPTLERPKWIPDEVPYGSIGFVKIAALSYQEYTKKQCLAIAEGYEDGALLSD